MIRVLHYIGLLQFGGSQSFVMEIYRKIDREKFQFDFVAFSDINDEMAEEITALGGRIFQSPQYNGKNHRMYVRWWDNFFNSHSEYKILHGHVRSVAAIYVPIAKKHGLKTIIHSHSISNGSGVRAHIKDLMQLPIRHEADCFLACSDEAGIYLFGRRCVCSSRYKTVHNAIDVRRFQFKEGTRKKAREECGLKGNIVIGNVGRLMPVKNHGFLIETLLECIKIERRMRLLLIGDGEEKERIVKKAEKLNVDQYVFFAGEKSNPEFYYNAMDMFCFPSLWEGLGMAVIEAQANGLACLVSDGVPEEVDIGAGLVKRLSLKAGAKAWARELLSYIGAERKECSDAIRVAGYDVEENVKYMQRFYTDLYSR